MKEAYTQRYWNHLTYWMQEKERTEKELQQKYPKRHSVYPLGLTTRYIEHLSNQLLLIHNNA